MEAQTEGNFFTTRNKNCISITESRTISQREKLHNIFHSHYSKMTSYVVTLPKHSTLCSAFSKVQESKAQVAESCRT